MTDALSFVAAYSRIRDLRQDQDVLRDILHAQEELGEVATELLALHSGEEAVILPKLQEEALDLAICAFSIYIGAKGKVQDVSEIITRKLDKWQASQDEILGFYVEPSGKRVEVRRAPHGLFQAFNVDTGTEYNRPCQDHAVKSLLELFHFEKLQKTL